MDGEGDRDKAMYRRQAEHMDFLVVDVPKVASQIYVSKG